MLITTAKTTLWFNRGGGVNSLSLWLVAWQPCGDDEVLVSRFLMRLGRGDEITPCSESDVNYRSARNMKNANNWIFFISLHLLFSRCVPRRLRPLCCVFLFFGFLQREFRGNNLKKKRNTVETKQDQMSNIQRQLEMFTESLQLSQCVRHVWRHNVHFCLRCQEEIMNTRHKHWFISFQKKNWIAFSFSDWWWQVYTACAPHKMFEGPWQIRQWVIQSAQSAWVQLRLVVTEATALPPAGSEWTCSLKSTQMGFFFSLPLTLRTEPAFT